MTERVSQHLLIGCKASALFAFNVDKAERSCRPGDDVIVPPTTSTEDAKKKFGDVRVVKP